MTVLRGSLWKVLSTAFAFSLVSVIRILPIHEELKVPLPGHAFGVNSEPDVFRRIDGWPVTGQWFMIPAVLNIPPSSVCRVWRHLLVKRLFLVLTVRDKRHGHTEPASFDLYSESFALVTLMPVGQIAQLLQGHLHLVGSLWKFLLPDGQRRVVHSAVYGMVGHGANGRLIILSHAHNDGIYFLNLGSP